MIELKNISKSYGKIKVLKNLTAEIGPGVYGLLGENGAGKTTLLKILSNELQCDSGEIFIDGMSYSNDERLINKIGYLPQGFDFYPELTVMEGMSYIADLRAIYKNKKEIINELLNITNISKFSGKKIKDLSGGLKQRFGIAQCLLGYPEVLILDEPTVSLDPAERLSIRNLLNRLGKDKTIVMSTHIIADISSSCENVGILKEGQLVYNGSVDTLLNQYGNFVYTMKVPWNKVDEILQDVMVVSIVKKNDYIIVRFIDKEIEHKYPEAKREECTLEDVYLFLTIKNNNQAVN